MSYSKKVTEKLETLRSAGIFTAGEADERDMRLVIACEGLPEDGNAIAFYWLVDPNDGVIVDVKYQAFGQSPLLAAAEAAVDLLVGKNYDQARRLGAELLDKHLRDHKETPAFPPETAAHLNLIIDAIDDGVEQCLDLPLPENYTTPVPQEANLPAGDGYPGWIDLPHDQKLQVIEEVLTEEIRPYIELDAGGIEVQELNADHQLTIRYQGACTSCFSSVGATLTTIQQILRAKVHADLTVVPDMESLSLN